MRKNLFIAALLFLFSGSASAEVITADSAITAVTVYPDSALVTREAQVKLPAGDSVVLFPGIIPQINEDSLRVSPAGKAAVKLYAVTLRREFLEQAPSEKIRQLQGELQKLQDHMREIQNSREVSLAEKNFLDSLRFYSHDQLPKELATKMPQAGDLESTLKFLDLKLKENYASALESDLQMREAKNKEAQLSNELRQISGVVKKEQRAIAVDVGADNPVTCTLRVSYLVPGVSWQPLYDARSDSERQEVELEAYALVRQNTGEDWPEVEMAFSTARPTAGGNLPYIAPWVLRPYAPPRFQRNALCAKSKSVMADSLQCAAFKEDAELAGSAVPEPAYAAPEERGTAVVYTVRKRVSVRADGSEQKLPIAGQKLKADFEYSTYPRLQQEAFLGSRVTNAKDFQFLAGKLNIFLDGEFTGSSSVGAVGPGEEFDLYLGADANVKVKKEQVEKKVDETLVANIPSPTKVTRLKYKLSVENYKSRKIRVKLFEAMPVAEDDRIKAKVAQVSFEPKKKDWEDRKGIWMWEFELEPKAKQEIGYSLVIEHPRDMQIEGL